MDLSLYAITKEQQHLEELLIETGGELTPELEEALAINQENFLVKAENYGYSILRIEAHIAAVEEQERRLAAQIRDKEGRAGYAADFPHEEPEDRRG